MYQEYGYRWRLGRFTTDGGVLGSGIPKVVRGIRFGGTDDGGIDGGAGGVVTAGTPGRRLGGFTTDGGVLGSGIPKLVGGITFGAGDVATAGILGRLIPVGGGVNGGRPNVVGRITFVGT